MLRFACLALLTFASFAECQQRISGYINPRDPNPIKTFFEHINASAYLFDPTEVDACWKDTYGRGVGGVIYTCPADMEKSAGLCYPYCKEGYTGVGPVCWEQCDPAYTDTGAFCSKGGQVISSNHSACPWTDVCGLTFSKGCSFCPPDEGWVNDGCTCRMPIKTYAKDSYGRGVGKPMGCSPDEEYDAALCYQFCKEGYYGVGPVCWQNCPSNFAIDYGAVCCNDEKTCNTFVKEVSKATLGFVASVVEAGLVPTPNNIYEAIKGAVETASAFYLYICTSYN